MRLLRLKIQLAAKLLVYRFTVQNKKRHDIALVDPSDAICTYPEARPNFT